ncbi:mechanosensitive ion channel family protein [Herminiimonas sp. CN]|uniref:mechanosensitive ion channel family protein n=1 Tax=Herminiimonas sp. CN TaxID=1349818 RepID=UPI000473F877|nr:mechanosensitive ion channel domain-containing protein [Herminiimonas sp. CN]
MSHLITLLRGRGRALLLLCALGAAAGAGFAATPVTQPAAAAPAIKPIAVPNIAAAAETADALLRDIVAGLAPTPKVAAIDRELGSFGRDFDATGKETRLALGATYSQEQLRELDTRWLSLLARLGAWEETLTGRAVLLENNLTQLDGLQQTWQATRDAARDSGAPDAVQARVRAVQTEIERVQLLADQARSEILTLQAQVSRFEARAAEQRAQLKRATDAALESLLLRDSAPIWSAERSAGGQIERLQEFRRAIRANQETIAQYLQANQPSGAFLLLLTVLFTAGLWRIRTQVRLRTLADPALAGTVWVFEHPGAITILLMTVVSPWVLRYAPHEFNLLLLALALPPTIVILRRLIHRKLAAFLYALLVLYVVNRLREMFGAAVLWERLLFELQLAGTLLFLFWFLRPRRLAQMPPAVSAEADFTWSLRIARAATLLFAVALAAEVLGYSQLGYFLNAATLNALYAGVILYAALRALVSLSTLALYTWPLRSLAMVRHYKPLLERRLQRAAHWLIVGWWLVAVLELFALRKPLFDFVLKTLASKSAIGALHVSLGDLLAFGGTIWAAFLLSRLVRFVLEEDIFPRIALARGIPYALSMMLHYLLLLTGFILAIVATGVDLDRFTILISAFGVGAGFGLQGLVNNFMSGLVLLFERPIKVGDAIETGQRSGEIKSIGIRASILRTWDGAEVVVPNASLISNEVVNWTLSDRQRRIEIPLGVAYGSDPEQVIALLIGVAAAHPEVLAQPAPDAFFEGFGADALNFRLRCWAGQYDRTGPIRSQLCIAVSKALAGAGIELPFAQRDLHLRSMDERLLQQLRGALQEPPP